MKLEYLIPLIFPVFFIAIWTFVLGIIAVAGGWQRLAKHYTTRDMLTPYQGKKLRGKSARFGGTSYKRMLIFGANMQGLYLATNIIFRFSHPTLFIPWSDITTEERDGVFMSFTTLTFSQAPKVKMTISSKLMSQLQELKTGSLL